MTALKRTLAAIAIRTTVFSVAMIASAAAVLI
jgi:hypothetical protein